MNIRSLNRKSERGRIDPATLLGLAAAAGALLVMMKMEGASVRSIFLPAPMILVFVGTIAATFASGTMKDFKRAITALPRAFLFKTPDFQEPIERLVEMADVARKEGLLSIEDKVDEENDSPFLSFAVRGVVDGTDPNVMEDMLVEKIEAKNRIDATGYRFYEKMGGYAPTIGIIGTVVSLTHVLENLSQPEELGHMIAAAFVATLWGVLSANFIWLPIGARLKRASLLESQHLTLIMEGVLEIQSGQRGRALRDKLEILAEEFVDDNPKNDDADVDGAKV